MQKQSPYQILEKPSYTALIQMPNGSAPIYYKTIWKLCIESDPDKGNPEPWK